MMYKHRMRIVLLVDHRSRPNFDSVVNNICQFGNRLPVILPRKALKMTFFYLFLIKKKYVMSTTPANEKENKKPNNFGWILTMAKVWLPLKSTLENFASTKVEIQNQI